MVQTATLMKARLLTTLLLLALAPLARAQETAASPDSLPPDAGMPAEAEPAALPAAEPAPPAAEEEGPAIPMAYDASRYDAIWDKNPFTRKVAAITQAKVDWGQDWALASMSKYSGKIRVSIRNKQTNEIKRIYDEAKEGDEFRLVKANFHRSRREASAVIAKGTEEATLKYDENAAPVTINNTVRQPANPGAVNPVPGTAGATMAGRPGQPPITKPVSPTASGRVFNAPNLPGGVAAQQGMMGGQPGMGTAVQSAPLNAGGTVVQPGVVNPAQPGGTTATMPPTISRRRQLIPAPVVPAPSNP